MIDQLHQQGFVGGQYDPQHVETDFPDAFQFRLGHQFIEEFPELVGDFGRDGNDAAGGCLIYQKANQLFRALFIGQQVARTHARRQAAELARQGMARQGRE